MSDESDSIFSASSADGACGAGPAADPCADPAARGEKHLSLYLAIRGPEGRRMVCVPPAWERTIRRWVASWKEADGLIDAVSRECVRHFLAGRGAPPEGGGVRKGGRRR